MHRGRSQYKGRSMEVWKHITEVIHAEMCVQFIILASERGKFEGANFKQIQGFAEELGETVSHELDKLIDGVTDKVNPSNDYPGALVRDYYEEVTGKRKA